jgi:hypothetical protein
MINGFVVVVFQPWLLLLLLCCGDTKFCGRVFMVCGHLMYTSARLAVNDPQPTSR